MRYDEEKARKIAALKAELTRHSRGDLITLATLTVLAVGALVMLLTQLSGFVELPEIP